MYSLNDFAPTRSTISRGRLGRGIHKVIIVCGEIKELVSESDKHYTYLDNPEDADLNNEFRGLNEEEVEDLKCE